MDKQNLSSSQIVAGLLARQSSWLTGTGPLSEVVISTRIRLARNIQGFKFVNMCADSERDDLELAIRSGIRQAGLADLRYVRVHDLEELDRLCLVERHLISKNLSDASGPRGLAITPDESIAVMVNEEDHLRLQVFRSGLQLDDAWDQINALDDGLEGPLSYAYSPRFGYLTACPTNVGTALRVSVMVHLPALKLTGEIEKVFRAARELRLAVRGLYGEGTDSTGDLFQISNQVSLGRSETEILSDFKHVVIPKVIEYERQARKVLLQERATALDDKVWRALGVLRHARALSSDEILGYLSHLRMGVCLGRLDALDLPTIGELLLCTQPAHLQKRHGQRLTGEQRSIERANLVRSRLGTV